MEEATFRYKTLIYRPAWDQVTLLPHGPGREPILISGDELVEILQKIQEARYAKAKE